MKRPFALCLLLGLAAFGGPLLTARAQVILNPNQISGTVRFSNSDPSVLDLLQAPGDEGMSNLVVQAYSLPPALPISATTDTLPVDSRLSAPYQITVDSSFAGIAYSVAPYVVMEGDQYTYWFNNQTSAPVMIGVTPPPLDFNECVGVVTVQFVDSLGNPVPVDGGLITAYDAVTFQLTGQRGSVPPGATAQRLYLRGDALHQLNITLHRGTSFYSDRIETFVSTNVMVTCDDFTTVSVVLPDAGTVGTVTGTVDMASKFELSVPGTSSVYNPDYTSVIAAYGPFMNQRWGALGGLNFSVPSSGPYTLSNVVPSTLDPASAGYVVYAQMAFGSNRTIEVFRTPALGWGSNPALVVEPAASLDLSNVFEIQPGYLRGRLLLQGPSESLGRPSLLRGIYHAGDDATDGIPNALGTYGVYWSVVEAEGVDRLGTGASLTASFGVGVGDFDGQFNPASGAFEGQYELALGGLKGENSIWKQDDLSLLLYSGIVTNDNDYYFNSLSVFDYNAREVELAPSQPVTNDVGYCFSEVKIVFRTTAGTFYNPQVRFSTGTYTNTDFQGRTANYSVYLDTAAGTPNTPDTATNVGQVVMYLPQGTYRLNPSVTPGGGTYALAGLEPLDVTVGCGQQIAFEPCLQLSLDTPRCAQQTVHLSGSVRSCTNNVASITYQLNGGATQPICFGCGQNPSFAFDVTLGAECAENTLVVTATDASGGVSSVTTTLHYDLTPPLIQCPTSIVTNGCGSAGAIVNFAVTATDNCSGPVSIVATPPSGSLFPPGTNLVTCTASDACGNINQCSFTVTVTGSTLNIERAIILTWGCGGTLQGADNVNGPWTDLPEATSPYAVATSAARKFYRVKN